MIGIIKNDLYVNKKSLIISFVSVMSFLIVYITIKTIIFQPSLSDDAFTLLAFPSICLLLTYNIVSKGLKLYKFYFAVPVSPLHFLLGKYIYSILIMLFGLALSYTLLTMQLLTNEKGLYFEPYGNILYVFAFFIVMLSILIPIYLFTEHDAISTTSPLVIFVFAVIACIIINKSSLSTMYADYLNFYYNTTLLSDYIEMWTMLAASCSLVVSFIISIFILRRKEF